jgi:hypothetical protein
VFIVLAAAGAILAVGTQVSPFLAVVLVVVLGVMLLAIAVHPILRQGRGATYSILVVIGLASTCLIARPQFGDAWPAAQRAQCASNMRQLAIALKAYEAKHGSYTPAYVTDANGKPMHSWRVLLLPFLGEDALYRQYHFDEPWNSPNNMQVASAAAHHFRCPLAAGGKQALVTQFVALIGPETMWPGAQGRKLDEVTDGPAATLLLVEWPESDIVWTEPRDLPVEWLPEVLNPPEKVARGKWRHPGGINIVNADASTSFFKSTISRERLRAWSTVAGGEEIRDW